MNDANLEIFFMKICRASFVFLGALFFVACGSATDPKNAPPTEVLKIYIEASKKRDVETIKQTLSKGSLELAEKSARVQNTTVDEMLRRDNASLMPDQIPEMRNERIEGDTATVEVKDLTEGYDTIPFVKEDGAWKISFDKYQQTMMDKVRDAMKSPPPDSSNSNAGNFPANK